VTTGLFLFASFALTRASDRAVTRLGRRLEVRRAGGDTTITLDDRVVRNDDVTCVRVLTSTERMPKGYGSATTFHLLLVLRDEAVLLATSGELEPVDAGARALADVGFPRRENLARPSSLTPPGALLWAMLFSCVAAVAGVLGAMVPIIWPSGTAVVAALAIAGLHVLLPWPLIALARSSYRQMFERGLGASA
ncbi:MAG TPA: hypothetical protein VMZ53_28250, partial [Kofleriaceae bacterium]|nr:hypothetical protein [Kofleriaceae bacterium]